MKISQNNFMIAWNNKKLVHGALKRAHVRRDYDRYEDLYQNAVLVYAEMLETHPDLSREEVDKLSFGKIIWKTLNELHKVQLTAERGTSLDEAFELGKELPLDEALLLKDIIKELKAEELAILVDHIAFQKNMSKMSEELQLHPASIRRIKSKLLRRLKAEFRVE